jgi:hypothetical protein
MPNTSVAGIDVSRMSPDEAATEIAPLVESAARTRSSSPSRRIGSRSSPPTSATASTSMRRSTPPCPGAVPASPARSSSACVRPSTLDEDLELIDTFDEAAVEAGWRPPRRRSTAVSPPDRSPSTPTPSRSPTSSRTAAPRSVATRPRVLLIDALNDPGREELELPVDTEPQRVPDEDLRSAAAQVERAVVGPTGAHAIGEELILQPEQHRGHHRRRRAQRRRGARRSSWSSPPTR